MFLSQNQANAFLKKLNVTDLLFVSVFYMELLSPHLVLLLLLYNVYGTRVAQIQKTRGLLWKTLHKKFTYSQ